MKPFQLLVKPAAGDCNLACEYCFYRETTPEIYPEQSRHRMSHEVMERMVTDLLSYRFPETIFCWQGGEPTLMGLDFFEDVVATQIKHGRGGQTVGNALQTNGILINEDWAKFLARYKVVVGLSLDGPRELHDRYRINRGGEGTFERVLAAAEVMRRQGVAFNILCVVNRVNQERAREVYRFFRAHGFDYVQFIPALETDPATGAVTEFSATPEGLGRFFREAFDEYRRDGYPHVSERNFDAVMNLHLSCAPGMCTFDERCGEYLVVEHNGDVYPCDFFVREQWRLGNVMEQPLAEFFSHPLMKKFSKAKGLRSAECGECERLAWCHGGCLKDRLPHQAQGKGKTWFCQSYQELFASSYDEVERWVSEIRERESAGGNPVTPTNRKVGRNEPCPCASGKKFKKCCGRGG